MPEGSCGILVVEDEAVLRLLLTLVLVDEGFEVRTAPNGLEALLLLARWQPDIILLDLHMPVMDGSSFRAEQRLVPNLATIPVLLVSAAHDLTWQAAKLETAGSIQKPYELDDLVATVRGCLDRVS